mgnify:CR=1 FL=1
MPNNDNKAMDEEVTVRKEEIIMDAPFGRKTTEKKIMKERFCEEFHSRTQGICSLKLNNGNLTRSINAYAVPIYSHTRLE